MEFNFFRSIVHFLKLRWYAKPFDIWKELQDDKRKTDGFLSGYYISYDGKIYYGHPLAVFIESEQNAWWLNRNDKPTSH